MISLQILTTKVSLSDPDCSEWSDVLFYSHHVVISIDYHPRDKDRPDQASNVYKDKLSNHPVNASSGQ